MPGPAGGGPRKRWAIGAGPCTSRRGGRKGVHGSAKSPPAGWGGLFVPLTLAHFLQAFGFSSMISLPLWLEHHGHGRAAIGTVLSAGAAAGILVRPLVAWSLDRRGRNFSLLWATLLTVTGLFLLGGSGLLLEAPAMLWVYLGRILIGAGAGACFSAYFTYASDLVPEARRTQGLAWFGVSGLLPVLGNAVAEWAGLEPPALPWYFVGVGGLVLASLAALWPLRGHGMTASGSLPTPGAALRALTLPGLSHVWWVSAVIGLMVAAFMTFVSVVAAAAGVDAPRSPWLAYTLGALLVRVFGGRWMNRVTATTVMRTAFACYALSWGLCAVGTDLRSFLAAAGLAGVAHGVAFPVLTSVVVTRIPIAFRGTGVSVMTGLWDLSMFVGTPLLGLVADRAGDQAMAWMLVGAAGFGILAWTIGEGRLATRNAKSL